MQDKPEGQQQSPKLAESIFTSPKMADIMPAVSMPDVMPGVNEYVEFKVRNNAIEVGNISDRDTCWNVKCKFHTNYDFDNYFSSYRRAKNRII